MIQAVLAQVHPGEDHFRIPRPASSRKAVSTALGVQAPPGPPDLGHNAVAALVAAALLDLEPGPGVAGNALDLPGPEGGSWGERGHQTPRRTREGKAGCVPPTPSPPPSRRR